MDTDITAKKVAKMYGFIEGTKGFETAVKIFKDGADHGIEKLKNASNGKIYHAKN